MLTRYYINTSQANVTFITRVMVTRYSPNTSNGNTLLSTPVLLTHYCYNMKSEAGAVSLCKYYE